MEVELINEQIGKKIRDLRNTNGLTQQELADRTELTKGYISQLERGQVTPSLITLLDLIECLGTNPSDFFKQAQEERFVFTEEDYFEKKDSSGNLINWLVPSAQNNQMEPLHMVVQPHATLSEDKPHDGEEFGYVLSGRLIVHLNDNRFSVEKGQSFYYPADRFHRIENPGDVPAVFLWISTPPSF